MKEFTPENYPMTDDFLLTKFLESDHNAYLNYKKCADLNKALEANAFKEKKKHPR
jgi:hypothetical protein